MTRFEGLISPTPVVEENSKSMKLVAEISVGELIDRLTILRSSSKDRG